MFVSIIIPVYNVALYIEGCLRSVMCQTFAGPMECLLVDDCCSDESIPIAERMIAEYDGSIRFQILHHDHNRGVAAARNTGMEKAVGDYVFFIDSDDEITEDCLEKMMAVILNHPEVELVQGRFIWHCLDGQECLVPKDIMMTHARSNDEVRCCFFSHGQVPAMAWNSLIKRSLIKDYNLSFIEGLLHEDIPWTFYWLKYVKNAWFLSDVTYHYMIRHGSIVTGTKTTAREVHLLRGYHDMITHLTPGYEKQEIEYLEAFFIRLFHGHSWHMPELMEDLKIYWHHEWANRNYKRCITLAICYIFRRTRWLGKIVYTLAFRLKKPSQITKDFACLWRRIKRFVFETQN